MPESVPVWLCLIIDHDHVAVPIRAKTAKKAALRRASAIGANLAECEVKVRPVDDYLDVRFYRVSQVTHFVAERINESDVTRFHDVHGDLSTPHRLV